jgi:hypothetical protein
MSRRSSPTKPDLAPLDTGTNITGSVHVTSPILFRSPTSDNDDDDSHKPLQDFKLKPRREEDQDHETGFGMGSGSGFGDDYNRYLIGSGSSAGMMPGSPMFGKSTDSQRGRTLSGSTDYMYPVKMAAGPVSVPVSGQQDGPTTSASLFLPPASATVKDGMERIRELIPVMVHSVKSLC